MNCNTYFDKKIEIKEAICLMETKINELVEMYNRIDADHAIIAEKVKEMEKLIDYLLGAGLAEEVKKKLEEWLADGTLAGLINNTVFKELNDKLNSIIGEIKDASKGKDSLKDKIDEIDENLKPIVNTPKLKGTNLVVLDNSEAESTRAYAIGKARLIGCDSIVISIPIYLRNDLPVIDSEERFAEFARHLQKAKDEGYTTIIAKAHTMFRTEATNKQAFFTAYEAILNKIVNVAKPLDITKIMLHNELHGMTKEQYRVYWQGIIQRLKTTYPAIECGFSLSDYPQSLEFSMYDLFDFHGVTFYPRMTQKGIYDTDENLIKSLYNDLSGHKSIQNLAEIKAKYNKPLYASEVGCSGRVHGLTSPAGIPDSDRDWKVSNRFYDIVLPTLLNTSCLDGIFTFAINQGDHAIFTGNEEEAGRTISKHFGGTL